MQLAICDDDSLCIDQLLAHLNEYASQNPNEKINYHIFSEPQKLFDAAQAAGGFDVYLLDILMPEINGIALGMKLREAKLPGKIIYLTSSTEYAIDSYKVKASNYLLKPVCKEALFASLNEILHAYHASKNRFLIVKTTESSTKLLFEDICYVELSKRKLLFHLTNQTTLESTTIRTGFHEAVQELLRDSRFILCGAAIAVNLQHITSVSHDHILFQNCEQLYLSKKGCRELRSAWYDYCFNKEEFYDNL